MFFGISLSAPKTIALGGVENVNKIQTNPKNPKNMKTSLLRCQSAKLLLAVFSAFAALPSQAAFQYFNGTNTVLNWDNGITTDWAPPPAGLTT